MEKSCGKVSMAWQERLLSLSRLKKDYFKSGKVSENTKFVSLRCQWEKERKVGGQRSGLKVYFDFLNYFFFYFC